MNTKKKKAHALSLNYFLVVVLGMMVFAGVYFLYKRQRSSQMLVVNTMLVATKNAGNFSNIYTYLVPYWVDEGINVGEREIGPVGGINAEVTGKRSLNGVSPSRFVNLTLKIRAVKDRTGIYLYKNKPLSVGNIIELNFPKAQAFAVVQSLDEKDKRIEEEDVIVTVLERNVDSYYADQIKTSQKVVTLKGDIMGEVIEKTEEISGQSIGTSSGPAIFRADPKRKDIILKIKLKVQKREDGYMFFATQKLIIGDRLFLPFEKQNINFLIADIQ